MQFKNKLHKERYYLLLGKDNTKEFDVERQAFFYLCSGIDSLYDSIESFYDPDERMIRYYYNGKDREEDIKINPKLSSIERTMMAFAFHLFNWRNNENVTPFELFQHDQETKYICLLAICLRFKLPIYLGYPGWIE